MTLNRLANLALKKPSGQAARACKQRRSRSCAAALILLLLAGAADGQTEPPVNQYRFDYDPTWQLNKRWIFDTQFMLTFSDAKPNWWDIGARPTLEFDWRSWLALVGGVEFTRTHQADSFGSFETKPYGGIRLKWDTPWRGLRLVSFSRFEWRIQRDLDAKETKHDRRLRSRIQIVAPLNHRSLSADRTWYVLADAETFWTAGNEEVRERFNSSQRYRAGLAWRQNATWTYQFIYTLQQSRNNIGVPFSTTDHIWRFRFIQTIKH